MTFLFINGCDFLKRKLICNQIPRIEKTYIEASESVLGLVKSKNKQWVGREIWRKLEGRKAVKKRIGRTSEVKMIEQSKRQRSEIQLDGG